MEVVTWAGTGRTYGHGEEKVTLTNSMQQSDASRRRSCEPIALSAAGSGGGYTVLAVQERPRNRMGAQVSQVEETVSRFYEDNLPKHHRFRSWEHCYLHFQKPDEARRGMDRDHASLHLAFYLASWGMYRGSSFLLGHTYKIHLNVVAAILDPGFDELWNCEFGCGECNATHVQLILKAIATIRQAYSPFARKESCQASDTLVTKVLLGTFGCLPAYDRYFLDGLKAEGLRNACPNKKSIEGIHHFCQDNEAAFRKAQARIENIGKVRYPLMKIVDMYFWQRGCEAAVK